jgi:hypothetical protein
MIWVDTFNCRTGSSENAALADLITAAQAAYEI